MDELKELIQVVKKSKLREADQFENNSGKNDLYKKVIKGIKAGEISSEFDIARLMNCKTNDPKFKMFKSRLKKKLLERIHSIDLENVAMNNFRMQRIELYKYVYYSSVLDVFEANELSRDLLEYCLQICLKTEFKGYAVRICIELRKRAAVAGNLKEYNKYVRLISDLKPRYEAEVRSVEFLDDMYIKYAQTSSLQPELAKTAKEYADQLNKDRKKHDLPGLKLNYFRLRGMQYVISKDYKKAAMLWERAEKDLKKTKLFEHDAIVRECSLQLLNCYLFTRNYKKAFECIDRAERVSEKDLINWFTFMEYNFLTCMQSKNYYRAGIVLKKVLTHERFIILSPNRKEKWHLFEIYQAYSMLAFTANKTEQKIPVEKKSRNAVPIYAKDKKGYNVSIIVLQLMYLLENREFHQITSRIDALKQYIQRYLKKDENTYRSNLFLKMIISMDKSEFDYDKTISLTNASYKSLKESSTQYDGNMDGMEIIPFETLWERILELIKQSRFSFSASSQQGKEHYSG